MRLVHYEGAVKHIVTYEMNNQEEQPQSMDQLILDPVWGQLGSFSKA